MFYHRAGGDLGWSAYPWVASLRNESSDLTFCRKPASVKGVDSVFPFAELFLGIGRDENGSSVFNGNIISAF